ncbi:MAG TPA: PQQ-binding-like beta-propeller repeat protein, partial [Pirellulaceae bacterium]|nr:PQQ-binding-like beta-propeller repeat protein [Pirellulaceae bacterium]
PIIAGDLVIGTCGFVTAQKHFVAVRPTGDGKAKEVWRIEKAVAYMPTPIVKSNRIFSCTEKGIFSCIDAKSGKVIWQERLDNEFSASPVCAGNAIYCTANDGQVYVVAAADSFKRLGRCQLPGATQSTPAIAADCMTFRAGGRIVAVPRAPVGSR